MFRSQLPRIYELRDLLPTPLPARAYFQDLDNTLTEWPQKLKQFRDIEADLQSLDDVAWSYLKGELAPLPITKHETRGWQQLFDKLNQAKAYRYLARIGCTDIRFIPESRNERERTPDLQAFTQGQNVLCEVKTINVSDDEANRFHNQSVGDSSDQLPEGFFRKLDAVLMEAIAQMQTYCSESDVRQIAYIITNFDDRLHEYADQYLVQINQFLQCNQATDLEVVLDMKPAFYVAQC